MAYSVDHPSSVPDNDLGVLAAGLTGLVAGFLASFADALISTQMDKAGWIQLEIARALAVLVPLGCLGGIILGIVVRLLGRIYPPAQKAVLASLPFLWCFALFVYLAVHYYQGLAVYYPAYVKCALFALVLGIPSYAGLRMLWQRFSKGPVLTMLFVGVSVGVCAALIELFIVWKGSWTR